MCFKILKTNARVMAAHHAAVPSLSALAVRLWTPRAWLRPWTSACLKQTMDNDDAFFGQAEVFEEIASMDFPFEGIPTVPPRKDMDHMVSAFSAYKTDSGFP